MKTSYVIAVDGDAGRKFMAIDRDFDDKLYVTKNVEYAAKFGSVEEAAEYFNDMVTSSTSNIDFVYEALGVSYVDSVKTGKIKILKRVMSFECHNDYMAEIKREAKIPNALSNGR